MSQFNTAKRVHKPLQNYSHFNISFRREDLLLRRGKYAGCICFIVGEVEEAMNRQDENNLQREGLETARCPTGVGSNPTPCTFAQDLRVHLIKRSQNRAFRFLQKMRIQTKV